MDVPRHKFQACLPFILEDIANAHFVSIDLELSGIPGPQINKSRLDGVGSSGKPTLQERYTEIKRAVERYQVLQLGLTCVLEDKENGWCEGKRQWTNRANIRYRKLYAEALQLLPGSRTK